MFDENVTYAALRNVKQSKKTWKFNDVLQLKDKKLVAANEINTCVKYWFIKQS